MYLDMTKIAILVFWLFESVTQNKIAPRVPKDWIDASDEMVPEPEYIEESFEEVENS